MIEREITISYNGKKFQVKFPNVGQLIDIESLKNALTGGKYGSFAASGVKSMYFILDIVDTIAFLTVMCPKLKNFITEEEDGIDYTQMKPETVKALVNVYKEQILPWYSKIMGQLYSSATNDTTEQE
jgi:hypothetical protein